ncbi:long-chain fatty acid--CoA ligase [Streptomyces aurantiogriseus]|uniref:long-chain fatty acid--CoA ligase n=1 Tax=Streptomyces aurantiogriseus TaxID=66870 RepID=UPI001676376A|nr:long-chain fatty acid--CoA ligase [Streptomyces aurantiogriseus]
MRSTMQDTGLQIRRLLEHGSRVHATSRIVTAGQEGHSTTTYAETGRNAARLAGALRAIGVGEGDRVATFMWNNQQHVEAYFAVPAMGAVIHPLNVRLFPEQIVYTANHAEDQVVIVDHSLLPVFLPLLPGLRSVRHVIVNGPANVSVLDAPGVEVQSYEALLHGQPDSYAWPEVDERSAAAMCYTSGTTGDPKGVVYSHRSIYLHSMAASLPDVIALSREDLALAVVPQFHVLAWSLPYGAFLTGASLAMPDRFLAPEPLAAFIAAVRPTKGVGVPTVWGNLLRYLEAHPEIDISSMEEIVAGGSASPESMVRAYAERYGITLMQGWGMTETSPLGSFARPSAAAGVQKSIAHQTGQGRFCAQVEARLIDEHGDELPWDNTSVGELQVRGPWVTGSYYGEDTGTQDDRFSDGWLRTGDMGRISPDGCLTLTDRMKDVIKSGGEWISSVELENHLADHPAVLEACVIGVPDDKWGERPLACVVLADGPIEASELKNFLNDRIARWQLPERWVFLPSIAMTSTGKYDKKALREQYAQGALRVVMA